MERVAIVEDIATLEANARFALMTDDDDVRLVIVPVVYEEESEP